MPQRLSVPASNVAAMESYLRHTAEVEQSDDTSVNEREMGCDVVMYPSYA